MKKAQAKEADLGNGPIGSLLFKLALPAIVAQIINVMYNMVDRMYIGHIKDIGPDALTGVGVTMPLIMAISAFAALVSMGGAPRASIMMGKGEKDNAEKILGNCTTMLVLMALVLTAVILIFGQPLLLMFGASENTIGYAWDYMKIYAIGTIFVQISLGLNAFINAQGFAMTGMCTVAIGAVCKHHSGSHLHFWFPYGRTGRCACNHPVTGGFLRMGSRFPHLEEKHPADPGEKSEAFRSCHPAQHRTRRFSVHHAVYGKRDFRLL